MIKIHNFVLKKIKRSIANESNLLESLSNKSKLKAYKEEVLEKSKEQISKLSSYILNIIN